MVELPKQPTPRKSPSTVVLSDELEADINKFAAEHHISKSAAIRYMVSVFLQSNYRKTIENSPKPVSELSSDSENEAN